MDRTRETQGWSSMFVNVQGVKATGAGSKERREDSDLHKMMGQSVPWRTLHPSGGYEKHTQGWARKPQRIRGTHTQDLHPNFSA